MPRIAILGGSYDPPGRHHRELAERLAASFDEVIVVPQGVLPDRSAVITPPVHRATMADITFRGLDRVRVDLFDLEEQTTQGYDLEERYGGGNEIWHVVPADLVRGCKDSSIYKHWEHAAEMWARSRFIVLRQPNEPACDEHPPHSEVMQVSPYLPAAAVRGRVFNEEPIDEWVLPEVADYVARHGLYLGVPASRPQFFRAHKPRFRLFFDAANDASRRMAERLRSFESKNPEMIVVLGGDGTMLRAIRQLWRERLPFYGLNTGHLGFLLNDRQLYDDGQTGFWDHDLRLYHLSLLWVEAETIDGEHKTGFAFNEVWVERESGQTAWVNLRINGQERIPKLVCDGVLVSTAAGSTAYARAMGVPPVPFATPVLLLAGSNVLTPTFWRPTILPITSEVEVMTLDADKRPLLGYMDGVALGRLRMLRARISLTAAVELAFQAEHDPVTKLAQDSI